MRVRILVGLVLCMSSCQVLPPRTADWSEYTRAFDSLDSVRAMDEMRAQALETYEEQPDDPARLKLAYVLSRPNAPLPLLERSRGILAEIPPDSPYAAMRDLLDGELRALVELRRTQGYTMELEERLEALKAIEEDLQRGRRGQEDQRR